YRQSSTAAADAHERDPDNRLLARMNRRRLDLEALRDSLLCVSGALDRTLGGPAVDLIAEPFSHRRTIYGLIERQNLPGVFRTFDFAGPDTHSPQRFVTTVPQQALFLMNGRFVAEQAQLLSAGSDTPATGTPATGEPRERIARLYRSALGRSPTESEASLALGYIAAEAAQPAAIVIWRYGFGQWDAADGRLKDFSEFAHFSGTHWQAGPQSPDPVLSYLGLRADGGHPGTKLAVVRRWTAPSDGAVTIDGTLEHPDANGNGVEGIVISSRHGLVGHWVAEHNQIATRIERVEIARGDTIDFVVDPRGNDSYDSFHWAPKLRQIAAAGQTTPAGAWDAKTGFHGPPPPHPDAWAKLAQVLLLSNEFVFLD
ncbi:MAG TPA: DUF1553 domain-containing protein, partial [Pirellulales bacterium]